jgi:transposase
VSSSGTNTLGYGKTKEAIHEAHAKGMTLLEAAKHYGITYASAYGGAKRSGLVFKRHNNRALYGHVKLMVIYESQSGLTMAQIAKKHGFSYNSVRSVNKVCKLGISYTRKTK